MEIINSLCYKGKVDLYIQKKNNKEIHIATLNEGLQGISELFTRACLGYDTSKYVPKKIDLLNDNETSVLIKTVDLRAASFDVVNDSTSYMNNWKYPVFDALILTENMLDLNSGDYYLVLLSDNDTKLARVGIHISKNDSSTSQKNFPIMTLNSENNILVRWSMYLSNKEIEQNG